MFISVCFSTVVLSSTFIAGAEFSAFPSDSATDVGDSLDAVPSVAFLAAIPSVCFFSSTGFEEVDSFDSVATGVAAVFSAAGACSVFFSSTLPAVEVWSTFVVSSLAIVDAFSTG